MKTRHFGTLVPKSRLLFLAYVGMVILGVTYFTTYTQILAFYRGPVVYWLLIFWFDSSLSFAQIIVFASTLSLPVVLAMLVSLYIRKRRQSTNIMDAAAMLIGLVASVFCCASTFAALPHTWHDVANVSHLDSVRLGDHVYHLARLHLYDTWEGGQWHIYAAYECDSLGLRCTSVHQTTLPVSQATAAHLTTDPDASTVSILIDGEAVYRHLAE